MSNLTEIRIDAEILNDRRSDFEKYSLATDYSVDWDDPFGFDFTIEFHFVGKFPLDPDYIRHNRIIRQY